MDTFEGNESDPLSLHRYLYCHANPVGRRDPSGQMTLEDEGATMSNIGSLAARTGGAVARLQTRIYLSYAWSVQHSLQIAFWTDVASLGASFLPEVLNAAADFGDSLNRQAARSEGGFSAGIVRGVEAEESILRPAIENAGGKFLGGQVSGIDGLLAVGKQEILIQGKTHDVNSENLLSTIGRGMRRLQNVDERQLYGNTSPSVGGYAYGRPPGPAAGKVYAVLVPEGAARTVISPAFVNGLRRFAEQTKVIPIVRVVRNWRGAAR